MTPAAKELERKPALLVKAGRVAHFARNIVGDRDINGFPVCAANVNTLTGQCEKLRAALDDYEQLLLIGDNHDTN